MIRASPQYPVHSGGSRARPANRNDHVPVASFVTRERCDHGSRRGKPLHRQRARNRSKARSRRSRRSAPVITIVKSAAGQYPNETETIIASIIGTGIGVTAVVVSVIAIVAEWHQDSQPLEHNERPASTSAVRSRYMRDDHHAATSWIPTSAASRSPSRRKSDRRAVGSTLLNEPFLNCAQQPPPRLNREVFEEAARLPVMASAGDRAGHFPVPKLLGSSVPTPGRLPTTELVSKGDLGAPALRASTVRNSAEQRAVGA